MKKRSRLVLYRVVGGNLNNESRIWGRQSTLSFDKDEEGIILRVIRCSRDLAGDECTDTPRLTHDNAPFPVHPPKPYTARNRQPYALHPKP